MQKRLSAESGQPFFVFGCVRLFGLAMIQLLERVLIYQLVSTIFANNFANRFGSDWGLV